MAVYVITGANRGIGLEMTRQLLERGETVFAGAREPEHAKELVNLRSANEQNLTILRMDVVDLEIIRAAVERVADRAGQVDVLINNAGVNPQIDGATKLGKLEAQPLISTFHTNAVGPLLAAQEFLPLLRKGKNPKVISISSSLGSIELTESAGTGWYAYNISKAAENMAMRYFAWDVRDEGITSIMIHPGWVRTDMGGSNAHLSPEESAKGLIQTMDKTNLEQTGQFLKYTGEAMPW